MELHANRNRIAQDRIILPPFLPRLFRALVIAAEAVIISAQPSILEVQSVTIAFFFALALVLAARF
jgi:hypothetical protein